MHAVGQAGYIASVKAIASGVPALRAAGKSSEQIARIVHGRRRAIQDAARAVTPPGQLRAILARNLRKYGDELGPTMPWLRRSGKSWDEIIESASRPGGHDLGF